MTTGPITPKRAPIPVIQRRLFLSCVSLEFRAYRDLLAANLAQPGVELRRQEDFVNAGQTTLEKLDDYIRTCDAVIHLVGLGTGAYPEPAEVEILSARLPDFVSKFGLANVFPKPGLSYTQWEAWLCLYYDKPLALYRAADVAQREVGFARDPGQQQRQQQHWQRLERLGRDRKEFASPHDLSIEVLRALPLMVSGFAENVRRGEFRDRNLLFAILAMQDEILSREAFVRVCTLWAGNIDQPISDLMQREGLLAPEDRLLVEARLERKLKARGGNVRQSLAESLGSDVRVSLGDALAPDMLASLPDRMAALGGLEVPAGNWRYKLTRTHGSGGLGVVSIADDSSLERSVAVKQMRPERILDPMAVERFIREARITGRLQHPNIIPVYELGLRPDDQIPFYAMRFVGHRTLQDAITQHFADKTSPAGDRIIRFRGLMQSFLAVCNAVAFAHDQGVIHRDLKPANIMIGDFGEVILLDWGLAKRLDEAEPMPLQTTGAPEATSNPGQTQAGARIGSPAYMAPEQAAGRIDLHGTHTDIYGLGVTLYEILTGDVPFMGATTEELLAAIQTRSLPDPRERNSSVPTALAAVCRKAMEKASTDRYASVNALADDIQHWLADEPVSVIPEPVMARIQRVARKNPGPVAALAATILVGIVGLGSGLYFVNAEKNQKVLALEAKTTALSQLEVALGQKQEALDDAETQRSKAVESSKLAARRFDEKRFALDEMLQTFSDDKLKEEPGSQPIRKLFLKKGIAQYQAMLADQNHDPAVVLRTGDALRELAIVTGELGEDKESLAILQQAIELCRKAVAVRPNDRTIQAGLGDALHEYAQLLFEKKRFSEVTIFANESVAIFESLSRQYPDEIEYKAKLGRSLVRRASVLSTAELMSPEHDKALILLRQAVNVAPTNPNYLLDLSRAVINHTSEQVVEVLRSTENKVTVIGNDGLRMHLQVADSVKEWRARLSHKVAIDGYKEAEGLAARVLEIAPAMPFAGHVRALAASLAVDEIQTNEEKLTYLDQVIVSIATTCDQKSGCDQRNFGPCTATWKEGRDTQRLWAIR
jgi:serine/threonine protein kinase